MKQKHLFVFVGLLIAISLILGACQPAATEAPTEAPTEEVMEEPTEEMEEPTEEMEEPTEEMEEPTEEMMEGPVEEGKFWTPERVQAVAAAIDREALVDRVFEGRNIPAYHMVPPGYPYATEPFLDMYGTRDLDMSIQLLTDLGYTEDNPFT
ncbi:MAG: hypothetical protein GWN30_17095, partial [Gammaproteobacteria bacterium]|nr:hypothetical protein [Gammaproteobacteria bacterium]